VSERKEGIRAICEGYCILAYDAVQFG